MIQDGHTYAYAEYHFSCHRCGCSTAGRSLEGRNGVGWATRHAARLALNRHLRTCEGTKEVEG